MMTKKTIVSAFALALTVAPAMAGGLLTNTNQNAAFLRNFAQEGTITLTSIYANPAGGAFLSNGWHLSLNSQTAIQSRDIQTTFAGFTHNNANPNATHNFEGNAKAPAIPSFTVSYNRDKWSLSAHGGLMGGGGKAEFPDGLGSLEAVVTQKYLTAAQSKLIPGLVPALMQKGLSQEQATAQATQMAMNYTYDMNAYMKGRSYFFGLQLGGTYKFRDNVAAYVGLRGVYATCNYNGFVKATVQSPALTAAGVSGQNNVELNCDQTGFGITPIIGVDWMINKHWNVSAKFEAPTKMSLKNETHPTDFSLLPQFEDGKKVREDIPGILAFGAQYRPIQTVRISAGFHEYFDKGAKKFGNAQDKIDRNTWEVVVGGEYDACKLITVSASYQRTKYGLSDAYMSDVSFNNSNHSIGFGVRLHPSKYFNVDLGYMHTFYEDRTVVTPTAIGPKTDVYSRKNNVFGIGFNFAL